MNVKNFWGFSLRLVDGVTQLCRPENLKEIVGKEQLVRNKLLEELDSLSLSVEALKSGSVLDFSDLWIPFSFP